MTTTKAASLALYAVLNTFNPDWRTAYPSIQAAADAAGDAAKLSLKAWSALFEVRRNTPPELPKVNFDRVVGALPLLSADYEANTLNEPGKDVYASVFDNSPGGRRAGAERLDEPGRESLATEGDEDCGGRRGAAPGRVEDPLFHPTRPHSDVPYKWVHTPPRSFGAIKCY